MKKIAEKIFTGYKWNGKKLTYKLNVYDEYEPKVRKKFETIEKNIIKYFENKKYLNIILAIMHQLMIR